jgi:dipeptidyl aminopeptidase/acylaminoacyl peptidase
MAPCQTPRRGVQRITVEPMPPGPIPASLLVGGRDLVEPNPSPDGQWVLFGSRSAGRSSLSLVPLGGGPERLIATDPSPALGRGFGGGCTSWLPNSHGFVYAAADGNVWCHEVSGARQRLTNLPAGSEASGPVVSPDGTKVAYCVDLARIEIVDLDRRAVRSAGAGADFVIDPAWRPDSTSLVWQGWSVPHMAWDTSSIYDPQGAVFPSDSGRSLQVQQPRFGPDGSLWAVTDESGWLNVVRDGRAVLPEPFEHAGPTWGPGQRSFAVAPDGGAVAIARNEAGFGRLVAATTNGGQRELGRGVHGQLHWTAGDRIVALRSGARTPTQIVSYDAWTGDRRALAVGPSAEWDRLDLVEPDRLEITSSDGITLHARRYGMPDRGLLCWVHGGPTDQWTVTFNPRISFWVSRGWAVLVPDHRGSTGHGRSYQQAMRGRWGELDVADVVEMIRSSHRSGCGVPATTVMMGGSAGGFTALNVAIAHPDVVAGAAVVYPVTDAAALDDTTHRFEAHYNVSLIGPRGQHDAAMEQRYRDRSPLFRATALRRPVLILHGDADPVVAHSQSEQFANAARAAGADVELHVYAGEGHGFRAPANQLDELARTEAFLDRVATTAAGRFPS